MYVCESILINAVVTALMNTIVMIFLSQSYAAKR